MRWIRGISMGEVPLLAVRHLTVEFSSSSGASRRILDDVSFEVGAGESLGLVGESGSGKTMSALAVMGLLPWPGRQTGGQILWEGSDLASSGAEKRRKLRGLGMAMIFQEPLSSLNPVMSCGDQVSEALRDEARLSKAAARARAVELLAKVGIPDPARRAADYPHQMSGGMRQRVMIAMALALSPRLLIADEPTTALDVTIQAQILELLQRLCEEEKLALLLITHNFGVVARLTQRVVVLNGGRVMEAAPTAELLAKPKHDYTKALLAAVPRLDGPRRPTSRSVDPSSRGPMLVLENVGRRFAVGRSGFFGPPRWLEAVRDVSLTVERGETLGLVGESGCGKTTLGRMILRLLRPSGGRIVFDGVDVTRLKPAELRSMRRRMQMVFQDPAGSLNPRLTVESMLTEPLEVHGVARGRAARAMAGELLEQVGLPADAGRRFAHQFSGGQRQRIGIARALALSPEFLVLDEPVSALDVSVQAQILDLLARLRQERQLTSIFVGHDLSVIRQFCDRVAVMYLGEVVEVAAVDDIYTDPLHPYTKALLAAVPRLEPGAPAPAPLPGDPPSPLAPPLGCRFHPRCPEARESCRREGPVLVELGGGRLLRCPVVQERLSAG